MKDSNNDKKCDLTIWWGIALTVVAVGGPLGGISSHIQHQRLNEHESRIENLEKETTP